MPLEKRRSERSFGGSFSTLSLGSFFGFDDDELDEDPLSEFQQQSLSVFESEHMWAHFKAHLAEKNIHTTAGVQAMLPEFIDSRVRDGSVQSERQGSLSASGISSLGPSVLSEPEPSRSRRVYPAAMRRQESFGKNFAMYGQPRRRSGSSQSLDFSQSQDNMSEHGIDSYHQAIRGDTDNVISLYSPEVQNDANLLRNVSKRLSKMTSDNLSSEMEHDDANLLAKVSRRLSRMASDRVMAVSERSNSDFSVTSTGKELSSYDYDMDLDLADIQTSTGQSVAGSSISASSRPQFRRPSICTDDLHDAIENALRLGDQLSKTDLSNPRDETHIRNEAAREPMPSSGSASSRLQFRRPSICTDDLHDAIEDVSRLGNQLPRSDLSNPRDEIDMRNEAPREPTPSSEGIPLQAEDEEGVLDRLHSLYTSAHEVETFCPKSFSYQPKRNMMSYQPKSSKRSSGKDDSMQTHSQTVPNDTSTATTAGSTAHKSSIHSSGTSLLVDWGEQGTDTEEEEDYGYETDADDSERAVVMNSRGDLGCNSYDGEIISCRITEARVEKMNNSHEGEISCSVTAAKVEEMPRRGLRRGIMSRLIPR